MLSFYDWDETLLGVSLMQQTSEAAEIEQILTAFAQSQYAVAAGTEKPSQFPFDLTQESYVEEAEGGADYPLTFKKGYNFAGWVQVNGGAGTESLSEAFTAYPTMGALSVDSDGDGTMDSYPVDTFNGERWNYEKGPGEAGRWGNIVLKAGYVENAWCNYEGSNYSYVSASFSRYGAASDTEGQYPITVEVKRRNAAGYGVTRLRKPALRSYFDIGGTLIYSSVLLENRDETKGEVVTPRNADSMSTILIDFAQMTNWVGATPKLPELKLFYKNQKEEEKEVGFVYVGTLNLMNEQGALMSAGSEDSTWDSDTNNPTTFLDLKLDISKQPEVNSRFWLPAARNKLLLVYTGRGGAALTEAEMQEAIELNASGVNGAAVFEAMQQRVRTAYTESGKPLTMEEIQRAINGE